MTRDVDIIPRRKEFLKWGLIKSELHNIFGETEANGHNIQLEILEPSGRRLIQNKDTELSPINLYSIIVNKEYVNLTVHGPVPDYYDVWDTVTDYGANCDHEQQERISSDWKNITFKFIVDYRICNSVTLNVVKVLSIMTDGYVVIECDDLFGMKQGIYTSKDFVGQARL